MKLRLLLLSIVLLAGCDQPVAQAGFPANFSKSKQLLSELYRDNPVSFYCQCPFNYQGKRLEPDLGACGYEIRKQPNRAGRIEWEHVVSAWELGHQSQCWQNGGRKNCYKNDPNFTRMEADLHNLVPAVGEVNGDRSNYRFGMITGKHVSYGQCEMKVDFKGRRAEPPEAVRGNIARTYFYMRDQYGLRISRQQQQQFDVWNRQDPPDRWECEREQRIAEIQGTENSWVREGCY